MECPLIVYTDMDGSWLLGAFGEAVPPGIPGV
jgi:hypothetical protein